MLQKKPIKVSDFNVDNKVISKFVPWDEFRLDLEKLKGNLEFTTK